MKRRCARHLLSREICPLFPRIREGWGTPENRAGIYSSVNESKVSLALKVSHPPMTSESSFLASIEVGSNRVVTVPVSVRGRANLLRRPFLEEPFELRQYFLRGLLGGSRAVRECCVVWLALPLKNAVHRARPARWRTSCACSSPAPAAPQGNISC